MTARLRRLGLGRPEGMSRLALHSWTKYDPSEREGAPIEDLGDGSGHEISVTGGWSTTNPFAGIVYYDPHPLRDRLGRLITGTDALFVRHLGALRTEPTPEVSDICIMYGICDRIPGAGSENAQAEGVHHQIAVGADRACRRGRVEAGVGALPGAGTSREDLTYYQGMIGVLGLTSRELCTGAHGSAGWRHGLDASGAPLIGGVNNAAIAVADSVDAWYRFITLVRVSATDTTTRTLAYDWYDDTGIRAPLES